MKEKSRDWKLIDVQGLKKGISIGLGFVFALGASALLAVAVSGTMNTFTNGSVMDASTLKTAIEGITSSQWTTSGSNIYYNAGSVGIGTSAPGAAFEVRRSGGDYMQYSDPTAMSTYGGGRSVLKLGTTVSAGTGIVFNAIGTDQFTVYADNAKWGVRRGGYLESPTDLTLSVTDTNKVLIGTTTPDGSNMLTVNSSNVSKTGGGSWNSISDIRLKHSVSQYEGGLELIEKIHPILFHYRNDKNIQLKDDGRHIGISAQELQKIIPDSVESGRGGYLQFKQDYVFWTMLNAVKQLKSLYDHEKSLSSDLSLRLRGVTDQLASIEKGRNAVTDKVRRLTDENTRKDALNATLTEQVKSLTEKVKLQDRVSQQMEARLRAIETMQMANAQAGKK